MVLLSTVALSARGSEWYGPTMARGTYAQVVVTHDRHRVAKEPDCEPCCAQQPNKPQPLTDRAEPLGLRQLQLCGTWVLE